jgi:hypothetical protein
MFYTASLLLWTATIIMLRTTCHNAWVLSKETLEKRELLRMHQHVALGAHLDIGWDSPVRKARREVTKLKLLLDYGFLIGSRIIIMRL